MMPALQGMRVCVTGGTGFVGRHVLRALEQAGAECTCLVRAASQCRGIAPSVRMVEVDMPSGQGMAAALHNQDAVIHLAALLFATHWQAYIGGNALMAEGLGRAIMQYGTHIQRVVMVSSLAVTGPCATSPGVEDDAPPQPISAYGWSKFMAEQVLARHVHNRMVTLRPPIIYGSGDKGLLPYFRAARRGVVVSPGFGRDFPISIIHVQDVVQAILCCLLPQAHGVYHCHDGAEHSIASMGAAMATAFGRVARVIRLPLPIMGLAAGACSLAGMGMARMGMRAPSWNIDKFREARQAGWLCAGTRIVQELHFSPTIPLHQGVQEAIQGYKKLGWLT